VSDTSLYMVEEEEYHIPFQFTLTEKKRVHDNNKTMKKLSTLVSLWIGIPTMWILCMKHSTAPSTTQVVHVNSTMLELELLSAKALLMSLGVPESNLCIAEVVNTERLSDDDQTVLLLWLPLCDRHSSVSVSSADRMLDELDGPSFAEDPWFFVAHATCALACVVTAALAAGLTMGLLSLDPLLLLIKIRAGSTQKEKDQAAKLLPIVRQHHLLLVTLLLLNSIANEALPIFLEVLVPPIVAIILSVTFVLFFGEIIPSAVFTGPQKIELASKMVPLVRLVMVLLWPLAYPIAKILDMVLHEEEGGENAEGAFNRGEISALVRILYEERIAHKRRWKIERKKLQSQHHPVQVPGDVPARSESLKLLRTETFNFDHGRATSFGSGSEVDTSGVRRNFKRSNSIHIDEVSMVEGALQMKTKMAMDVLTPLHRIYAVPYDMILNEENVVDIYSSGYSRIPVYEPNPEKPKSRGAIRGILITKNLIVVDIVDHRPLSTVPLLTPPCVSPKMNLVDLLNLFQTGKSGHCALVCARPSIAEEYIRSDRPIPLTAGLLG
jgi:metal transporter CNNM